MVLSGALCRSLAKGCPWRYISLEARLDRQYRNISCGYVGMEDERRPTRNSKRLFGRGFGIIRNENGANIAKPSQSYGFVVPRPVTPSFIPIELPRHSGMVIRNFWTSEITQGFDTPTTVVSIQRPCAFYLANKLPVMQFLINLHLHWPRKKEHYDSPEPDWMTTQSLTG